MEQQSKPQKMSVYFPPDLLERVRQHAVNERRSFNKDVLWLLERALEAEDAVRRAAHYQPK